MTVIKYINSRKNIIRDLNLYTTYYNSSKTFNNFSLDYFKQNVLSYIESLNTKNFEYLFSSSAKTATLYSSCYACMIKGLFNYFDNTNLSEWVNYFDSFQADDGLFYENTIKNSEAYANGDGWGARHLLLHMCIAYERLGKVPKKEFKYLYKYKSPDKTIKWLEGLDLNAIYYTSNKIMNIICAMQYARDKMNENFNLSIVAAQEWLLKKYNLEFGLWTPIKCSNQSDIYEAIRGSYHIFPIFVYDGVKLPANEFTIKTIIKSQNVLGGFDFSFCSSACYDIDAIEPMVRFSDNNILKTNTFKAAEKSFKWIMSNQNIEGGFVFQRYMPFTYGGEKELSSKVNESNMFATWFRTLSILYIYQRYICDTIKFLDIPGYEMSLK